jgi:MFS family permease
MNIQKKLGISLSKNILFLYFNRLLVQSAFGLITGFGTLFFYERLGESVPAVLLLYAVLHFAFAIFNHISAKFIKVFGMRKMMIFALLSLSVMFLSRTIWDFNAVLSLGLYFISYTLYKSFYWIPYHVEFAAFTTKRSRGKQTAILYSIGDMFAAALPFFGGFILGLSGYNTLFYAGFVLVLLSILPLFHVHETREVYRWSLRKLIHEIFDEDNRPMVTSNFGNGMQMAVASTIWPIFVFITTDSDYIKFGAILAVVSITLILLQTVVGRYLDKFGREKVLRFGNVVYFTGWLFKALITSVTGIFVIDTYHRFGNMINTISFNVTAYDQAADNGHFIDEYTVLRETAALLGRVVMYLILIPVVMWFGIKISFVLGAMATLLMVFINKQLRVS